jgi:hypothetical protein
MPVKIPLHPRRVCWECRFYQPGPPKSEGGDCHARPPRVWPRFYVNEGDGNTVNETSWPEVSESDTCGAFELNYPPEALPAVVELMRGLGAVDEAHAVCRKQIDDAITGHVPELVLETITGDLEDAGLIERTEPKDGQPEEAHYYVLPTPGQ